MRGRLAGSTVSTLTGRLARSDRWLAALLVVIGAFQLAAHLHGSRAAVAAQTLVMAGAVAWRRSAPLAAVAVLALGGAANLAIYGTRDADFVVAQILAGLILTYSVGAHVPRWDRALAGTALGLAAFWLNDAREGNPASEFLASAVLVLGPWVAGRVVEHVRRQAAELRVANAELAVERDRARDAAAAAERARIARELHDIVAHSLSVIAPQADAAGALLDVRPDDAHRSVDAVRSTAQGALHEVRRLLGHLREDDAAGQVTLGELGQLVTAARAAGADVALDVTGTPTALPPAVDVSAFRIVQEGLTNARRHAGGAACAVTIGYAHDAVAIDVHTAPGRGSAGEDGPGYGLVGVRERVSALGGTLQVGPAPDGGWHLRAQLPLA